MLSELTPGKAKRNIPAGPTKAILAGVRPRDVAGKTRRQLAVELLGKLMDLTGVGPVVAARILADVGDVDRFGDRNRSPPGPAPPPGRLLRRADPPPAVPGRQPAGQPRDAHRRGLPDPRRQPRPGPLPAQARRRQEPMEAMRCLKRRISDAGPGGHHGASLPSSAGGSHPHSGTSDQPQPGPAPRTLSAAAPTRKTTTSRSLQPASWQQRGAAVGVGAATPGRYAAGCLGSGRSGAAARGERVWAVDTGSNASGASGSWPLRGSSAASRSRSASKAIDSAATAATIAFWPSKYR